MAKMLREATAVLAAILVAFGLDAWWDNRAAAVRRDELLSVISREFETAVIELDSLVALDERSVASLRSFIRASATGAPVVPRGIVSPATYKPAFGGLNTLLSSGGLADIDEVELQKALADWPARLEELDFDERHMLFAFNQAMLEMADRDLFLANPDLAVNADSAKWERALRDPAARRASWMIATTVSEYTAELALLRNEAQQITEMIGQGGKSE
jgi:hypothetical protein